MSIEEHIRDLVQRGCLFPVLPPYASSKIRRRMFVTLKLQEAVSNPPNDLEARFIDLHADLVLFVTGRWIPPNYLKHLEPTRLGVWEIRSHQYEPQIRVFGQFAKRDVFIGFSYRLRDELGGIQSPFWNHEIRRVRDNWNDLFSSYRAKTTADKHKLFTGAIDDEYFQT